MASRAQQKQEARQRRLAMERANAERAQRQRRLQMLLGVVVIAVIAAVVGIVLSSSGGKKSPGASSATAKSVNSLLAGIPQSGTVLGNQSTAKVNVTEYGDLECPVCAAFATGAEQQLISHDVRAGKATLTYKSLCTATCGPTSPNTNLFPTQQAAALAAGQQGKAWNYILLFYNEQGQEDTAYVTDSFLSGLAQQIPGLNVSQWASARTSSTLTNQVTADEQAAATKGFNSTPTIVAQGPKGSKTIVGNVDYSTVESAVQQVS